MNKRIRRGTSATTEGEQGEEKVPRIEKKGATTIEDDKGRRTIVED